MSVIIHHIKYSLIGEYNYLRASPENYKKTQFLISEHGFIPNQITVNKINNNDSKISVEQRMQFNNIELNQNINFLPDRVDFEFNRFSEDDVLKAQECKTVLKPILEDLKQQMDLKASRLAVFVFGLIDNEKENLLINNDNFYNSKEFIEWANRVVLREKISLDGKNVEMNKVIDMKMTEHGVKLKLNDKNIKYNCVQFNIDLNTVFTRKKDTYNINDLIDFIDGSEPHLLDSIKKIEDLYYG